MRAERPEPEYRQKMLLDEESFLRSRHLHRVDLTDEMRTAQWKEIMPWKREIVRPEKSESRRAPGPPTRDTNAAVARVGAPNFIRGRKRDNVTNKAGDSKGIRRPTNEIPLRLVRLW